MGGCWFVCEKIGVDCCFVGGFDWAGATSVAESHTCSVC